MLWKRSSPATFPNGDREDPTDSEWESAREAAAATLIDRTA